MSLFPDQSLPPEEADAEALSPVLGHLIDLSLAVVLMERPLIVSPYSVSLNTGACLATSADHVLPPRPFQRSWRGCKIRRSMENKLIGC